MTWGTIQLGAIQLQDAPVPFQKLYLTVFDVEDVWAGRIQEMNVIMYHHVISSHAVCI